MRGGKRSSLRIAQFQEFRHRESLSAKQSKNTTGLKALAVKEIRGKFHMSTV